MENNLDEALKIENQFCFPLYATARKIVNAYTPILKPLNVTYTQYIILLVLWEYAPITVGGICEKLFLDNGTVTPILKKMEKDGYITRSRRDDDERVVEIKLTKEGIDLKEKFKVVPYQVASCLNLKENEAKNLYQILYKILSN